MAKGGDKLKLGCFFGGGVSDDDSVDRHPFIQLINGIRGRLRIDPTRMVVIGIEGHLMMMGQRRRRRRRVEG